MSHLTLLISDTSCSMHQKTLHHLSTLDLTKSAMERLIHQSAAYPPLQPVASSSSSQQQSASGSGNKEDAANAQQMQPVQRRFLLSTCHGPIRGDLLKKIKSLQAWDLTTIELAIRDGLKEMNKWRVSKGVDRFGQGRWVGCAEASCVVVFTDRGKLTSLERGTSERLMVPMDAGGVVMQHQWCVEPFRWDQRIFGIVLGVPYYEEEHGRHSNGGDREDLSSSGNGGNGPDSDSSGGIQRCSSDSVLSPLCEVTGGTCVQVRNMKQLFEYVDHLVQNVMRHDCVVVNFDLWYQSATPARPGEEVRTHHQQVKSPHTSIYIHTKQNYWPIPESYFPTSKLTQIPPRHAHPNIIIQASSHSIDIPEGFPVDQYEIDSSCAVAQFLIQNKITQSGLYRCYVRNSGPPTQNGTSQNNAYGAPFGFVKAIIPNNGQQPPSAHFYVLPYNYPTLFKLLRELNLFHMQQQMPSLQWRHEFEKYCTQIPPYYVNILKSCVQLYYLKSPISSIVESLFPTHLDTSMSYALVTQITNMTKQEKHENEVQEAHDKKTQSGTTSSMSMAGSNQWDLFGGDNSSNTSQSGAESVEDTTDFRSLLLDSSATGSDTSSMASSDADALSSRAVSDIFSDSNRNVTDTSRGSIAQRLIDTKFSKKNPFDIHRSELLSQHEAMRCKLFGEDELSLTGASTSATRVLDPVLASKLAIARHSVPISQMGDYGAAAAKKYILRNPLSDDSVDHRFVNFGSPYAKKKKKSNKFLKNLSIDEADAAPQMQQQHSQKKQYAQRRERAQPKKKPKKPANGEDGAKGEQKSGDIQEGGASPQHHIPIISQGNELDMKEATPGTPLSPPVSPVTPDSVSSPQSPVVPHMVQHPISAPDVSPQMMSSHTAQPKRKKRPRGVERPKGPGSENKKRGDTSIQKPARKKVKLDHTTDAPQMQRSEVYREMIQIVPHILDLSDHFINSLFESIALKQSKEKNRDICEEIQTMIRTPLTPDQDILQRLAAVRGLEWKFSKMLIEELAEYAERFKKWDLNEKMLAYVEDLDARDDAAEHDVLSLENG
eukprot:CAMPEP_0117437442 /NCGR_PEP_ID=MMETSP0759-20121206/1525_1 /TAXON_ID=63605 /ORGANISM="Percolomonas cosmopolitus, Strain WS" /LENGTH=1052 /DNA_ID=CAMNT_0005229073 /DNA_START=316 /DNA_END=3474 /DNA_ORIENTATION=+